MFIKNAVLTSVLKTVFLGAFSLLALPADAQHFYQLESALTLPSKSEPDWDYLVFDQDNSRLFISRRHDGISVYDAKAGKILTTLGDTAGGNAVRLVPEYDRAYVINQDGAAVVFQLSTLRKIDAVKFGDNADNIFYDTVSKQLMITMGDSQATFPRRNHLPKYVERQHHCITSGSTRNFCQANSIFNSNLV